LSLNSQLVFSSTRDYTFTVQSPWSATARACEKKAGYVLVVSGNRLGLFVVLVALVVVLLLGFQCHQ
jgi:hypothetical protein